MVFADESWGFPVRALCVLAGDEVPAGVQELIQIVLADDGNVLVVDGQLHGRAVRPLVIPSGFCVKAEPDHLPRPGEDFNRMQFA